MNLLTSLLPFLLLTRLTLAVSVPHGPPSLHETVQRYLSAGGQESIRASLNLSAGVYYDPLRLYTREDISAPWGVAHSSARFSSDLSLLRALNVYVPGVDPLPPASARVLTPKSEKYNCRTGDATVIAGTACKIFISYSPSTPDDAKQPVGFSLKQWADEFRSDIGIRICFVWDDSLEDLTLGATTSPFFIDGSSRPNLKDDALYSPALASALEGEDVILSDKFHVHMVLNHNIKWHLDTNTPAPVDEYDLSTTVLHELTHGLFFSGTIKANLAASTAEYTEDSPGRFDQFMKVADRIGVAKMCTDDSNLFNAVTNPSLRFVDASSGANFGLYSPSRFVSGSSTYHFDNETLSDDCDANGIPREDCSDLMTHQLEDGYTQRAIGETTRRVLRAMHGISDGVEGGEKCDLPDNPIEQDSNAQGAGGQAADFTLPPWGIATVAVVAGVGSILVFGVVISSVVSRREGR